MPITIPIEKWTGKISEVTIGATKEDGGTRNRKIVIGGDTTLPCLDFEGLNPNPPVIAMEVIDMIPDVPELSVKPFKDAGVLDDAVKWAKLCEEEYHADMIALKLKSTNPEGPNRTEEEAAKTVKEVLKAVAIPLIIYGSGNEEKDAKLLPLCAEIVQSERCVLGMAEGEKYKSLAATSIAYNQNIIAFSNIDINLAKQLNILLTDFGVKKECIIMDPLMGGLGMGIEYSYSVIERIRLAALQGDTMLQMPILCDTTLAWNAGEATKLDDKFGDVVRRGIAWETVTAITALNAGANVLVMRHPEAVRIARATIEDMQRR